MLNTAIFFLKISVILIFCSCFLFAQNFSGILEMKMTEYDAEKLYTLFPELKKWGGGSKSADKILAFSSRELRERAEKLGQIPEQSTIKMQFAENMFRVDFPQMGTDISMIQNLSTNKMYNVQWEKQLYTEIDLGRVAQMQKGVRNHYQNPPNPFAYLDTLPPEKRAELLQKLPPETLKKLKENRGPFPLPQTPATKRPHKIIKTGRKAKVHGYTCEEYRINRIDQSLSVWVAPAPAGLLRALKNMSQNFEQFGGDDGMNGIWEVAPNHMPVLAKEFQLQKGLNPHLVITQMMALKQQPIPVKNFKIPAHFKKATMLEMMNLGRGKSPF
ncbi:MAG: DUF4412 domain-containing protein [Calditrichaeota bacterium]|nr:MAG: DUF4412 domain-containing protein [Calditrichota bacterium]